MGRDQHVVHLQQRVVHGCRFLLQNVETRGGDFAIVQSANQGGFVDHRASASVYEYDRRLHHVELAVAYHMAGLGAQRNVQGDHVGGLENFVQRQSGDVEFLFKLFGNINYITVNDLALPALKPSSDPGADAAQPNDPNGLAGDLMGLREPLGPNISGPLASAHSIELQLKFPDRADDQTHCVLGDGDGVPAPVIGNTNAQFAKPNLVKIVSPCASGLNQPEVRALGRQFYRRPSSSCDDERHCVLHLRRLILD